MKRFLTYALTALLLLGCTAAEKNQPQVKPEPEDENGLAFAALSVINMREDPEYSAELGTQVHRKVGRGRDFFFRKTEFIGDDVDDFLFDFCFFHFFRF